MPLQEIIDGGHAINVHLSADEIDTYIACGDIGGAVTTDEGEAGARADHRLGRAERFRAHRYRLARRRRRPDPGRRLPRRAGQRGWRQRRSSAGSHAGRADAGADAAAESVAVEIKDFAFNPPEITVPVGGSVTWTNDDSAPHTATGLDREVLQSGAIAPGESFTQTFDTAGTFDYFCEFHANMKGSIVVE